MVALIVDHPRSIPDREMQRAPSPTPPPIPPLSVRKLGGVVAFCAGVWILTRPHFLQVVNVPSLRQLRLQRTQHPGRAPIAPRPRVDVAAFMVQGLQVVIAVQQKSFTLNTVHRQDAALEEFNNWLAEYGEDSTPLDCTPEQVLVYIHCCWIPRHGPKGKPIAPTTVLSCPICLRSFACWAAV
jgi:hypothetical protein